MATIELIINNKLLHDFNFSYLENKVDVVKKDNKQLHIKTKQEEVLNLENILKESKHEVIQENFDLALKMLDYLLKLFDYLHKNKTTIIFLNIEDFLVINNDIIIFNNSDKIFSIDETQIDTQQINISIVTNLISSSSLFFLSNNQIENMSETIDLNTLNILSNNSIGYLLLYILNSKLKLNNGINIIQANSLLKKINGNKIYYFIERCISNTHNKLIYI